MFLASGLNLGGKMKNRFLLISIRYLAIILIIFTMILYNKTLINMFSVGIVLLYIINNQVRFFNFQQREAYLILSILVEWIIVYISFTHHGGVLFFYFLPSVLDGAFFLKEYKAKIISFLAIIAVAVIGRDLHSKELLITTFSLITLIALSNYIKEEVQGKLKAQELYDKLRISEEELKKAKEDIEAYASSIEELTLLRERNRISREIHDSVGHSLSTTIIQLGAIEKMAKTNGEMASTLAKNLGDFVKESLQEVRGAVRALKPREFEKYEGILAIEELVKNFQKLTGVQVKLRYSKQSWNLNSDHSFVIYRVIQEFMSNSLRHGKATEISIFMHFNQDNLIITLRDNGVGAQKVTKGIGLQSIWERVNELRGEISYDTEVNKGFTLKVVLHPNDLITVPNQHKNFVE